MRPFSYTGISFAQRILKIMQGPKAGQAMILMCSLACMLRQCTLLVKVVLS